MLQHYHVSGPHKSFAYIYGYRVKIKYRLKNIYFQFCIFANFCKTKCYENRKIRKYNQKTKFDFLIYYWMQKCLIQRKINTILRRIPANTEEIKKGPTHQTKYMGALFPLTGILLHRSLENKTLSHFKDGGALMPVCLYYCFNALIIVDLFCIIKSQLVYIISALFLSV